MAKASSEKFEAVLRHREDIRDLTDKGIEVLIDGLRFGSSYHGSGWNPRHIEGFDHFFFYSLENLTGKKFIHGQPVSLGVYIGSLLHNSRAEEMLTCMHDIGLDIRPEAMGVTWKDAAQALFNLREYARKNNLWYSIAHDTEITHDFVSHVKKNIESIYGEWK
jgi:glycerol dehydrogenase-like iron-containing ADH family enzyme